MTRSNECGHLQGRHDRDQLDSSSSENRSLPGLPCSMMCSADDLTKSRIVDYIRHDKGGIDRSVGRTEGGDGDEEEGKPERAQRRGVGQEDDTHVLTVVTGHTDKLIERHRSRENQRPGRRDK